MSELKGDENCKESNQVFLYVMPFFPRMTLGNKGYYTNQCFFKSRLVPKKSKLKFYWSIIRPAVTDGCGTWVLKETITKR
jgi:hypothetical protein